MGRIKWIAAAVLAVVLYGAVAVGGTPSGEAAVGDTHRMTIPAAAFIPTTDNEDYLSGGYYVSAAALGASLTAPLVFPVDLDHVRIQKVTFWASDNDGTNDVCLYLYRAQPKAGSQTVATQVCSDGASLSTRWFSDRTFRPRTGKTTDSFYLWLWLQGDGLTFYGATIDWKEV